MGRFESTAIAGIRPASARASAQRRSSGLLAKNPIAAKTHHGYGNAPSNVPRTVAARSAVTHPGHGWVTASSHLFTEPPTKLLLSVTNSRPTRRVPTTSHATETASAMADDAAR